MPNSKHSTKKYICIIYEPHCKGVELVTDKLRPEEIKGLAYTHRESKEQCWWSLVSLTSLIFPVLLENAAYVNKVLNILN